MNLESRTSNQGFTIVEVLLATAILGVLVAAFLAASASGLEATALSGTRLHASQYAEEGLEATRNIQDENFSNLSDGNHGLAISGNQWTFSGTSDTQGILTRQAVVSTVDANTKQVTSTVTWQQNLQRTGSIPI